MFSSRVSTPESSSCRYADFGDNSTVYEPKTKLVQPELIPDRFDIGSTHAALQVNELLRRGRPLACRWGKCDAIMACETMLDKHMHRSGHLRKALVISVSDLRDGVKDCH